jgi:hypothetical protein
MKRSEQINELSKALTDFQKSAPKIAKEKTGKIAGKTKAGSAYEYEYKYADLAGIWEKIRGHLADNELSVIQSPSFRGSDATLTTVLAHSSGQWVEDEMQLKAVQDTPQGQGSAITYARRYMLCAMLGIVADSDNDAQDHRTLTPIQKKTLYSTAKRVMPELGEDPISMVRFISEVVGKHPSRILVDEFDDAIQAVETYTSNAVEGEGG